MHIDNSSYKFLPSGLGFNMPGTCNTGIEVLSEGVHYFLHLELVNRGPESQFGYILASVSLTDPILVSYSSTSSHKVHRGTSWR